MAKSGLAYRKVPEKTEKKVVMGAGIGKDMHHLPYYR